MDMSVKLGLSYPASAAPDTSTSKRQASDPAASEPVDKQPKPEARQDLESAISAIQDSVTKNISQVDLTVQTTDTATMLADKSGVVLTEILGMADQTADQVHSIATASEEQSATSEEINRSISQVNSIATETSSSMQEATNAVSELAKQAQNLLALVKYIQNVKL